MFVPSEDLSGTSSGGFLGGSMKLRNWLLGAIALIVMVGSVVPAEAQYHRHHRRHYRHHRPYGRR
jgi:hypothetical protein